jgi:hypothetical protein
MFRSPRRLVVAFGLLGIAAVAHAQANDLDCNHCVDPKDIATGAVRTNKIAPKAVTAKQIRSGAVTTYKIKNGAVTTPKLSPEVSDAIDQALGGLLFQKPSASDGSGVAGTLCPANSLIASANCDCSDEQQTRNFGVLFVCQVAGNGGVAGCFNEAGTYNSLLPTPLATVTLVCVSGVQNDGTSIEPIFAKGLPTIQSKIDSSGVEFDTAVNKARTAVAGQLNALQSR